jgi:type I restriction enzyme M protein
VDTGEAGRWRRFTRAQIAERGDNLDLAWLKDDSADTAQQQREDPALLARLAMREMQAAMADLRALVEALGEDPDAALDDLLPDEPTPEVGSEAKA